MKIGWSCVWWDGKPTNWRWMRSWKNASLTCSNQALAKEMQASNAKQHRMSWNFDEKMWSLGASSADRVFAAFCAFRSTLVTLAASFALAFSRGLFVTSWAVVQRLSSRLTLRNRASPRPRFSAMALRANKVSAQIYSAHHPTRIILWRSVRSQVIIELA